MQVIPVPGIVIHVGEPKRTPPLRARKCRVIHYNCLVTRSGILSRAAERNQKEGQYLAIPLQAQRGYLNCERKGIDVIG